MNLQIGTILIAKEDIKMDDGSGIAIIKGNEYTIKELILDVFIVKSELFDIHEFNIEDLDLYFTIKRYTVQDLRDKKIAVKLTKKDDFYKICDLLGYVPNSGDYAFTEYHAVDEDNEFVWCSFEWVNENNYTKVESIDEIDFEVKEEVLIATDADCVERIQQLESEINRLKGELKRLEKENIALSLKDIPMPCEQPTPDQAKRERMAWELVIKYGYFNRENYFDESVINDSLKFVDTFIAKSKEVKDEE